MSLTSAEIQDITQCISRNEKKSGVELVLVIKAQSINPNFINLLISVVASFATVVFNLFCPWEVPPIAFLGDTLAIGILVYLIAHLLVLGRYFIPKHKIYHQIKERAAVEFINNGVHTTKDHIGVLIYISLLEGHAEVIADYGVSKRFPVNIWKDWLHKWNTVLKNNKPLPQIISHIDVLGNYLEQYVPRPECKTNELSNTPVV